MSEDAQEGEKTGRVLVLLEAERQGFGEHQTPGLHTRASERYRAKSERCSGRGTNRTGRLPRLLAGWGGNACVWPPPGGQVDEHACALGAGRRAGLSQGLRLLRVWVSSSAVHYGTRSRAPAVTSSGRLPLDCRLEQEHECS